jgi:hypothetical protein
MVSQTVSYIKVCFNSFTLLFYNHICDKTSFNHGYSNNDQALWLTHQESKSPESLLPCTTAQLNPVEMEFSKMPLKGGGGSTNQQVVLDLVHFFGSFDSALTTWI